MKRLLIALGLSLSVAVPASAFTFSLPDVNFPEPATTVSSQGCPAVTTDPAATCR